MPKRLTVLLVISVLGLGWSFAWAQNIVQVTPLGTHDGELCRSDRSFLFEDPNGTTLLFDVGRSVTPWALK